MKKYIIAIDQGTTSTRAICFDQNQNVIRIVQEEIQNVFPQPGWVEQDAQSIWLSTLSCISQLFAPGDLKPEEVASIGITNQRETTVVWNKKTGMPVHRAIVWQSRQTADIVERFKKQGLEEKIHEKTGLVLDPYFSATKIRWILEECSIEDPEDLLFGTVDTWLVWKMTNGKVHVTDVTNASRTLLMNIHTLDWDPELLAWFGVPSNMLPKIVDMSGVVGYVDPVYFFNTPCPIACLVGDQQSALFVLFCFQKGEGKNTYGTGGFLLMNTGNQPILSKQGLLSTVAWKIQDQIAYALEGSIFVSGSLIQWLRDGLKFFKSAKDSEQLATDVDSCNGVMIVPAFTGLGAPYWDDQCRGAIFGLTRGTDIRHLTRAALESMAYQSKDLIQIMEEDLNQKIEYLKVDGGASSNRFLNQFQSDILEIPVYKNEMLEMTALGAARLAGLAVDFFTMNDFKDGETEHFLPSRDHESVEKLYAQWKKAVAATRMY